LQGAATWRIKLRVIPQPPATLQCNSTRRIQCHALRAMSHCRVLPPGELNVMSCPRHKQHCTVLPPGEFNIMIAEERTTLQCDAVWQSERYVILEPRTCHIAGCCHLAHSITCHPTSTCYIAGCLYVSHLPHCR